MARAMATDGTRIHYLVSGPPHGAPVLFIQGLGADHRGWLRQMGTFRTRYRCVFPDNRGVGASDAPPGPYDLEVMADDMIAVLDDAGIESAHVVGASMGGVIAQILAVRYPDRVRSLSLACTACRHHEWRVDLLQEWRRLAVEEGMAVFVRKAARWLVGPRSLRRFWPLLNLLGPLAIKVPAASFVAQVDAICAMDDALADELHNVHVPTLIVTGSQDILTPVADAEDLAALIPDSEVAIIRGAAHGFMFEHAGTFNKVLGAFLKGVVRGDGDGHISDAEVIDLRNAHRIRPRAGLVALP